MSSQVDRLRLTADIISERGVSGGDLAIIEIRLREAADTIESLQDKLQATSETCEDVSTKNGIFKCSKCGCTVEEDGVDWGEIHYCTDCGKWVKR